MLNAGIPSYATARELELLRGLDRGQLRWLVVQYSANGISENNRALNDGDITRLTRGQYEAIAGYVEQRRGYYPGKHSVELIWTAFDPGRELPMVPSHDRLTRPPLEHATTWWQLMEPEVRSMPGVGVIVVVTGSRPKVVARIADAMRDLRDAAAPDSPLARVAVVDSAGLLSAQDHFILDDHLRPSGHAKIAAAIAERIGTVNERVPATAIR